MNRRTSLITGLTGIAAVSALSSTARAQDVGKDNPELAQVKAVLEAHDKAMTNHDLEGVIATMAPNAAIIGSGPGETWAGTAEIKGAYGRFFEDFDKGEQDFTYHVRFGNLSADMGWLMASGEVKGKKDGKDFAFPLNISITVAKNEGKWQIVAMHFSTLTGDTAAK